MILQLTTMLYDSHKTKIHTSKIDENKLYLLKIIFPSTLNKLWFEFGLISVFINLYQSAISNFLYAKDFEFKTFYIL